MVTQYGLLSHVGDSHFFAYDLSTQSPTRVRLGYVSHSGCLAKPRSNWSRRRIRSYATPPAGELLFMNAHHHEMSLLVDVSDPHAPRMVKTFDLPAPLRYPHDYSRTPKGTRLVGFLRSEGASPDPAETATPETTAASPSTPLTACCCARPWPGRRVPPHLSGRTRSRFFRISTGS